MTTNLKTRAALQPLDHVRFDVEAVVSEETRLIHLVTCVDKASGVIMGRFQVPSAPGGGQPAIDEKAAFERVGGAYRQISITVDLDTEILRACDKALRRELATRERLWRRRRTKRIPKIEAPSIAPALPGDKDRPNERP